MALFVFTTADDEYSHVASSRDVLDYFDSKSAALAAGNDFYRQPAATKEYTYIDVAEEFATSVRTRLQWLANTYDQVKDDFVDAGGTFTIETQST